ncbi:mitochondrial carrier domain-containing protein [Phyllosticta capitalensis]|uniref:Mitochondrial carrier domain-containing protein n=1 Tax=Phyllosticta capitalensis TaxID=121624 RepID=A0ABR1YXU8_9PEZI
MPAEENDAPEDISITQKMLSAVTGSILTSLLVTPLDVVRVRLQAQTHPPPASRPTHPRPVPVLSSLNPAQPHFSNIPPNLGVTACCREVFWVTNNASYCVAGPTTVPTTLPTSAKSCAVEETQRKTFNSTFDGLRKIARNEGPRTLWRGLSPTLVMTIPANVIYFAGYDWLRTSHKSPIKQNISDSYSPLVAGSTARVLAAIAVSPIEMFRTRMQATHTNHANTTGSHFRDTLHGVRDLVRESGWTSLWRGLGLTLWRDVPFSAIYWWGYETGRNMLIDERERKRSRELDRLGSGVRSRSKSRSRCRSEEDHTATLVDSFVAGASSGAVAAFVTTPFDVGKTRQQVVRHAGGSKPAAPGSELAHALKPEEQSMPRFLWHIFKEQGFPGLFRGWAARCLKVAPACAIMISTYEMGKKMAGDVNERRGERRH